MTTPSEKPEGTDEQETPPETPNVEELQRQLAEANGHRAQLTTRLDRLESLLIQQGLRDDGDGGDEPPARGRREPAPAPRDEAPDFENMSTKDLAQYVLGNIDKKLTAFSQDVDKKITQVMTRAETDRLVDEIAEAMEAHEDIAEYQQPIVKLMAANPNLSVEDAYFIVKRRAGKLDTGDSGKKSAPPETNTGLPPRGSSRPVATKPETPPKTFEDAGRAAWRKLGLNAP